MNLNIKQLIGLSLALFLASCVKSRPELYSPAISDPTQFIPMDGAMNVIDEKAGLEPGLASTHKLVTDSYQSRGNTIDAQSVRLKGAGFEFPVFVKIKTEAPLLKANLDQIRIFGKPNSEYKLSYGFTPKHLKIYKITPEDEITHYEKVISKQNDKGEWLVPIGGYQVNYFQRFKVPDADNRATNVTSFKEVAPENFNTLATHFTYDTESFIPFAREEKNNVYPSDFFKGDWYFATAIVSTKPGEESSIGIFDSSLDASLRKTATRIKFVRSPEFLRAVNTVVDSRVEVPDDQLDDVLNIPAEWLDYRNVKNDNYEDLVEEIDTSSDFNLRPFVKLDFKLAKSLIVQDESEVDSYFKGLELSDISFTNNSFSFTLLRISTGVKRKFSFLRVPTENDYKPMIYTLDDQKIFGYFDTKIERLLDIGIHRRSDVEKNILANRFNPNKKIVFRFSTQTPKSGTKDVYGLNIDYRRIGQNAVSYWNQVFKFIGSKNGGVVLDESEDNELGDFSFNTINIVTNLTADGLGGVGPTVSDPLTGEVINGTVNVYSATTIANVSSDLRNILKIERGLITDTVFSKKIRERGIKSGFMKEIRYFCPEVIKFAKDTNNKKLVDSIDENKVVFSCLEKIVPKRIEAIVVHEMGHTLGLRHNFFGSFDKKNSFQNIKQLESVYPRNQFPDLYAQNLPNNDESMLIKYSSIMDYLDVWLGSDEGASLPVPSVYDIFAMGYLYMNKVPLEGDKLFNGLVAVDMTKDINTNIASGLGNIRKPLYCTDEQALNRAKPPNIIDSGCALLDKGQTYTELMDYYFNAMRDVLLMDSKKLDKFRLSDPTGLLQKQINNMAIVYMDWRFKISKFMDDPTNTRLIGYNSQKFNEVLNKAKDSNSIIKDDSKLSEKYFQYLTEVADMSNYYCITKNEDNEVGIYEFPKLQKKFINLVADSTITSCNDSVIVNELMKKGEQVVTEMGLPTVPVQFSQKSEDARETFDIYGVGAIRDFAILNLGILSPLLYFNNLNGFKPSVLDEPAIYASYKRKVESRILEGLNVTDQLNYALELKNSPLRVPNNKRYKKFIDENALYDKSFVTLLSSNVGTDTSGPKRNQMLDFELSKTNIATDVPPFSTSVKIDNTYYYALPESKWSTSLINTLKVIKNPVDVDLSLVSPELNSILEILVLAVEDTPVVQQSNYVMPLQDMGSFLQKHANAYGLNQANPQVTAELELAFAKYNPGLINLRQLFRAQQINQSTGQDSFDLMGTQVPFARIASQIEDIQTNGLKPQTLQGLGFLAPLTQEAIVGEYLRQKDQTVFSFWKANFDKNLANLNDFEEEELTAYKAYLQNRISASGK